MKLFNFFKRLFSKKEQPLPWEKYIKEIEECNSLMDLMEIHKSAYKAGFNNVNLSPCPYGIFRTNDILTMSPDEVYLGGIFGLFTKTLSFWESHKDEVYGTGWYFDKDTKLYSIVLFQYKKILKTNILKMSYIK